MTRFVLKDVTSPERLENSASRLLMSNLQHQSSFNCSIVVVITHYKLGNDQLIAFFNECHLICMYSNEFLLFYCYFLSYSELCSEDPQLKPKRDFYTEQELE